MLAKKTEEAPEVGDGGEVFETTYGFIFVKENHYSIVKNNSI